jgi:hypothetical protein
MNPFDMKWNDLSIAELENMTHQSSSDQKLFGRIRASDLYQGGDMGE